MTFAEAKKIAETVTMKNPPWRHWRMVFLDRLDEAGMRIQISFEAPDRDNGQPTQVFVIRGCAEYQLRDERSIVHEVRKAIETAFLHELDESFHVNGVRVNDPHK